MSPDGHCWCYYPDTLPSLSIQCNWYKYQALVHESYGLPIVLQWLDLTHWGWVMHICITKLTIIGSDNGLSPGQRQAIIWTNTGILLIGPLGTHFSEILIEIDIFSFRKMHLKMSSGKWWSFCLCVNVLKTRHQDSSSSKGHQGDMSNWSNGRIKLAK